jgi:phospholipid/cholesterol/gamma-HCH transport system permease protein
MLAAIIAMPPLVLIADVIGVMGGWLIGVTQLGFNASAYIQSTLEFVQFLDVFSGLVKAAVFGGLIALIGCYCGFHSKGGARGVGAATTNAVVGSSIMILLSDYLLTVMFFSK